MNPALALAAPAPAVAADLAPPPVTLARCLLLAGLLHLLVVLLIGTAPGGGGQAGDGLWGAVQIRLASPGTERETGPADSARPQAGPAGRAVQPRLGGVTPEVESQPLPDPGAAELGRSQPQASPPPQPAPAAAVNAPLQPGAVETPVLTRPAAVPLQRQPEAAAPQLNPEAGLRPRSRVEPSVPSTAPRLAPADSVEAPVLQPPLHTPPDIATPAPEPALPLQPAPAPTPAPAMAPPRAGVEPPLTAAPVVPPQPRAPAALPEPPRPVDLAPLSAAEPPLSPLQPVPAAPPVPSMPSVSATAPVPAATPVPPVTQRPDDVLDLPPTAAPALRAPSAVPAAEAPAATVPAARAPGAAPAATPGPAAAGAGVAAVPTGPTGPTVGASVAAPAAAASAAPLNLQLPGSRSALSTQPGGAAPRVLNLVPPPPVRRTPLAEGIEKSAKPDCRQAYAGLGPLAVVPLLAEAARGSNSSTCRW